MPNQNFKKLLEIDPLQEEQKIIEFVKQSLKTLNLDGAVIGLSGGLDSSACAYLLKKALGSKKILGVILPERDSAPINMEHARLVAKNLGLKTVETNMTDVLEKIGIYDIGPAEIKSKADRHKLKQRFQQSTSMVGPYPFFAMLAIKYGKAKSIRLRLIEKLLKHRMKSIFTFRLTKARLRMLHLYYHAWHNNYAVVGTSDKSEYKIGFYDKHGDGANDTQILRHLYKTQIRQIAKYIGVPDEIIQKPSTADLYGNIPNESQIGLTYEQLDQLLYALEHGYPEEQLLEIAPKEAIENIKTSIEIADFVRKLPLSLD